MPDPKKNRLPLPNIPPNKVQPKILLFYAAIVAAICLIYYYSDSPGALPAPLKIQDVVDRAARGEIKDGVIRTESAIGFGGVVVTGTLPEKVKNAKGRETDRFEASGRLTDANLAILQQARFTEKPSNNLWGSILIQIVPFILLFGLVYFLFVRQLKGAGRGALSFGKSRAKRLNREKGKVTFADVAGCDEAKEEISEVVGFLKNPKKFQSIGGKIPKGILLVGPPGTGKTLLAKAVAGEADVPFFSISGSDFVEMFVGVGASRVRDMFEQGRKEAPCIVFIDEIDAVGRQRGAGLGGGNDEREQTLNSILVEMDGFDPNEGVIIIAATNRPDVLDSALLRPGRFDRQVYVDLPDIVGREQILKVHAKKIALADDVDLNVVARGTPGLSGAELANLLNEAALAAARKNKPKVDNDDLDEARHKVLFGRERRKVMDDEDKKIVAYHEAGHALVSAVIKDPTMPVHKVTIIPRGQSLGSTMYIPPKDLYNYARGRMLNRLAMLFGGRVAEETALGEITSGASGDIEQATKLARHMVCDWGMSSLGPIALGDNQDTVFLGREITRSTNLSPETTRQVDIEIRALIDAQYRRAKDIIVTHREALEKIAAALLEYETIDGKHVAEILEFGEIKTPVPQIVPPPLPPPPAPAENDSAAPRESPNPA
ncbi:MAG: ATP-dependent zinc metalloprotease FtsH [Opitutaceae bacterium]|jgi:cell division protease FtsH|nr:ATP-dependent zinc metalloprotease FtsH [Opitutaceae bacterium]